MRSFLLALQFLTVIPVRVGGEVTARTMGRATAFFPLAGAFQGCVVAGTVTLLLPALGPLPAAALAVAILAGLNGAFHLDGLSDTLDAARIKSAGDPAADRERRLRIMRDSTAGPVGVAGIVFVLLLKFSAVSSLLTGTGRFPVGLIAIVLSGTLSRWAMAAAIAGGRSARAEGLGYLLIENAGLREFFPASLWTILLVAPLFLLVPVPIRASFAAAVSGALAAVLAGVLLTKTLGNRLVGGLTGDLLGALSEIGEVAVLFVCVIWNRQLSI